MGLHILTSNASPIFSPWVPGRWWTKCVAVDGKTLTIHFCNCVISLCRKHKCSHSRTVVRFCRNNVCTMWDSSIGATTSSETVLAYSVTMSSNACWNSFIICTRLIIKPLSSWKILLVGLNSSWMAPPTCKEGIRMYGPCWCIVCIHFLAVVMRVSPHNNVVGIFLGECMSPYEG